MGEVCRAKDTKLDREVAVKVLPDSLAGDPERLIRFEREAKGARRAQPSWIGVRDPCFPNPCWVTEPHPRTPYFL